MSNRVFCKYFAHGACLKGDYCEFSHDWSTPSSNICTYYQKGICSYGSRCRYEHVKASQPPSYLSSVLSNAHSSLAFVNFPDNNGTDSLPSQEELTSLAPPETPAWNLNNIHDQDYYAEGDSVEPRNDAPAWNLNEYQHNDYYGDGDIVESRNIEPSERSLCSFSVVGNCPRGEKCPHIHGDLCPTCGKHCLHPFRPEEREEHMAMCMKKQKQLEALKLSQEIECSVCLEPVLSKLSAAERKFGILSECDHPFCISCIRNWRSTSPTPGMDMNSALRACPICRKLSYFITPSVIWYTTKEEKHEIMDTYKAKLKSIDCKHFDFGNGGCPFGTSCFYKHAYRDGSLEEVVLRHLSAEDGQTVIAKNIRLSDFLSDLRLR